MVCVGQGSTIVSHRITECPRFYLKRMQGRPTPSNELLDDPSEATITQNGQNTEETPATIQDQPPGNNNAEGTSGERASGSGHRDPGKSTGKHASKPIQEKPPGNTMQKVHLQNELQEVVTKTQGSHLVNVHAARLLQHQMRMKESMSWAVGQLKSRQPTLKMTLQA